MEEKRIKCKKVEKRSNIQKRLKMKESYLVNEKRRPDWPNQTGLDPGPPLMVLKASLTSNWASRGCVCVF
jgi:hypothetical protein